MLKFLSLSSARLTREESIEMISKKLALLYADCFCGAGCTAAGCGFGLAGEVSDPVSDSESESSIRGPAEPGIGGGADALVNFAFADAKSNSASGTGGGAER